MASGAGAAAEYDQIKAAADTARADLSAARAQANVAQNATGYAVLLADSDGVVMETLAEPGQVVSAGQVAIRLAICLLPFALAACGDISASDDPRTRPPLVRSASVERANPAARTFTGVVVARTQSDLGFRVQGKILERLVDTGQTVKQGQPLLRLDPVDLKLQAQAQQRAVDAAQARARKATSDEAR